MKLRVKPLLASLVALTLLLPIVCHADGLLQNGDTSHPITLFAASTSDGQTGVTGLVITLTISKNGGAFVPPTGTVTEIGGGYYKFAPSATDDGTDGELVVNASASGAYINPERRRIIAINPDDAAALGLTQITKIGTSSGDSPNAQAQQNTVSTNLDAKVSSRSTFAGGAVASVTAPVTLGPADEASLTAAGASTPAAIAAALFGSTFLTIPGSHTTTGTSAVLTFKQWQALLGAVPASDNASTAPVASGTATTRYYLAGQPAGAAALAYTSTVTYDANKAQTGRTVLIANPFPAVN